MRLHGSEEEAFPIYVGQGICSYVAIKCRARRSCKCNVVANQSDVIMREFFCKILIPFFLQKLFHQVVITHDSIHLHIDKFVMRALNFDDLNRVVLT